VAKKKCNGQKKRGKGQGILEKQHKKEKAQGKGTSKMGETEMVNKEK